MANLPPTPSEVFNAAVLVSNVLTESQGLAAQSAARGLAAIASLGNFSVAIPALAFPPFDIPTIDIPPTGTAPADPGDPQLVLAPLPTAPAAGPLGTITFGEAPLYNLVPPLLIDIDLPDPLAITVPAGPDLTVVGTPVEPDFTLPPVPQLLALNLPDAPTFDLAPFTETAPTAPGVPDIAFLWDEVAYESDELAALNTRLLDLVNGATSGWSGEVEAAMWNKECDAGAMLTFAAVEQALQDSAARGFTMPGGQMVRIVQQALGDSLAKDAEASRAVMVEAVRLEQQNFQFAFGQAMQLEARLIELFNQVQARALDAAKLRVSVAIDLFNARLNLYQAEVSAFGVKVDVFRARMQAVLGRLELYKAQLQAVHLRGELNVQMVDQYSAQIQAVKTGADIFKARVEAVALTVATNRGRTELYRADVEAYAALVKGNGALVAGYLAQVQAEKSKAQMFGHEVAAYGARVDAYRVLTDARLADVTFQVKQLQEFPMALYRAQIEGYQVQVQAEAARLGATADVFTQRIEAYAAVERAGAQLGSAQADAAATTTRLYASRAQIALQDGMNRIRLVQVNEETAQSALRAAGQLTTQLASAAMSARNVSAALTGSTSNSAGLSASNSTSISTSINNSSSSSTAVNFSSTTGINNSAAVTIHTGQTGANNQTQSDTVDQSVSNSTTRTANNDINNSVRNGHHSTSNRSHNYATNIVYQHKP
jgi:hypothetical protein